MDTEVKSKGKMKDSEKEKEEISEIINSEVEAVNKALKKEKSPGSDKITNEQIKNAGKEIVKRLIKIFNTHYKNN